MKIARSALVALLLMSLSIPVLANHVEEMSLEEKSAASDLVFIGQVVDLDCCSSAQRTPLDRIAAVRVETTLKGGTAGLVKVRYRSSIGEFDPACCELGKRYLFFLKRRADGIHESVNADFGMYEIGATEAASPDASGIESP